jgi:hypothetical protein
MTDWAFNGALRGGEYTYRVYLFTRVGSFGLVPWVFGL